MFKIGDFSKLSMTSVRMLRYYDEQGLLPPAHINQTNGYRYYTAEQLNDIAAIKLSLGNKCTAFVSLHDHFPSLFSRAK